MTTSSAAVGSTDMTAAVGSAIAIYTAEAELETEDRPSPSVRISPVRIWRVDVDRRRHIHGAEADRTAVVVPVHVRARRAYVPHDRSGRRGLHFLHLGRRRRRRRLRECGRCEDEKNCDENYDEKHC